MFFGQVGTAIFTFVIAVHTFSLLFLRRKWPDWACYTTLIISCTILALDLCIGNFVVANVARQEGTILWNNKLLVLDHA